MASLQGALAALPLEGRIPRTNVTFPVHTPAAKDDMPDIIFTGGNIIEALEGKKGNASPGMDGVTFGMLKLAPLGGTNTAPGFLATPR